MPGDHQRIVWRELRGDKHPAADYDADEPPDQERPVVEPPGVDAEQHRRQRLDDQDAAKKLQINRILLRHEHDEKKCAELDDQRHPLRDLRFLPVGRILIDEFAVDVARIEIGRGD